MALVKSSEAHRSHVYDHRDGTGSLGVTAHSFGKTGILAEERGVVAGGYAAYVDQAATEAPEQLVVEVRELDGEAVTGTDSIEREWVEAYNDGDQTGRTSH